MPAMPHLLLISRDPTALDAWRRGLAEAGVPIAGTVSPLEAPLRLRAMRPSMLVLLEPWDGDETRQTLERCRTAAEAALPAILVLWSSPWLRTPLPLDFSPASVLDASTAKAVDLVRAARLLVGDDVAPDRLVAGVLTLDPAERRLRGPAGDVFLTPSEAILLGALLGHPREVVRAEEVARALWGTPVGDAHSRAAIRTHLHTLRRKLASVGAGEAIRSISGVGYRLDDPEAPTEQAG